MNGTTQNRKALYIWGGLLFLALGLTTWFVSQGVTLEDARHARDVVAEFAVSYPAAVFALLVAAHAGAMAISLPLKALLNLLAGALLGTIAGSAATLIGVLLGTTGLFFAVRKLLRQRFQESMGARAKKLEQRLARRPIGAMIGLRLVVTLPYGPITIAAALTSVRYRDFAIGSAIGDLPVIALYSLAGGRLASLTSLSDVMSPTTLIILVAAGAVFLVGALAGGRRSDTSEEPSTP